MRRLLKLFSDLPIARKLLLGSPDFKKLVSDLGS